MGIYTIAITGASGSAYGVRLLQYLLKNRHKVFLIITKEGSLILKEEVGYDWSGDGKEVEKKIIRDLKIEKGSLSLLSEDNLCAPISSGSVNVDAMVIIPCSMKTLSGIAHGYANNLVERSADVMIKEGRPLILVPRETPLNSIHLRNMLILSEMGIKIIPPMPAFYSHPRSIEDIVDFIVGKVLDSMQIENNLFRRWKGLRYLSGL
ncbi:MAG: UbiX family flavin prenyltransferase [Nitrospira sp.]|nr:UbiX family flavin prenyltransferase [Nitrospira sp.]